MLDFHSQHIFNHLLNYFKVMLSRIICQSIGFFGQNLQHRYFSRIILCIYLFDILKIIVQVRKLKF